MRKNSDLLNDASGTSVLVEYLFIIVITAVFFSMFIFLVSSIINNTDQTVVSQELGVIANDMANRISGLSDQVNASRYSGGHWTSDVSGYSETVDLPELAQGKQYDVLISYDDAGMTGNITVIYGSNSNIYRTASFRSSIRVIGSTISSTSASPKICYDPAWQTITVVGY